MNVENGTIKLNISNQALERANTALRSAQREFPLAVARAANRAMYGMGTDAASETRKRYFVKASDVRKSIEYRKATASNMLGTMISRGKRHSLADYRLSHLTPKYKTDGDGKKVQVPPRGAVKREGGLKSLGQAFLVKRAKGRYFPFYRVGAGDGNKNKGIQSLISPSIPQIVKNEETVQAMERGAEERFRTRLEHEIEHIRNSLSQ